MTLTKHGPRMRSVMPQMLEQLLDATAPEIMADLRKLPLDRSVQYWRDVYRPYDQSLPVCDAVLQCVVTLHEMGCDGWESGHQVNLASHYLGLIVSLAYMVATKIGDERPGPERDARAATFARNWCDAICYDIKSEIALRGGKGAK